MEKIKKDVKSPRLPLFKNAGVHSKVIGASSRALMSMISLVERKQGVELIRSNFQLIQSKASKLSQLSSEDRGNISRLELLMKHIDSMIASSQSWMSMMSAVDSTKISAFGNLTTDSIEFKKFESQSIVSSVNNLNRLIPSSDANNMDFSVPNVLFLLLQEFPTASPGAPLITRKERKLASHLINIIKQANEGEFEVDESDEVFEKEHEDWEPEAFEVFLFVL